MQSAFTNWFAWNGAGVMAAYFKEYYPSGDLRCKEAPGRFFFCKAFFVLLLIIYIEFLGLGFEKYATFLI